MIAVSFFLEELRVESPGNRKQGDLDKTRWLNFKIKIRRKVFLFDFYKVRDSKSSSDEFVPAKSGMTK